MSFIFLFLFSLFTSSRAVAQIAQDPFFIYNVCPNTTTYSKNSTYFANLRTLLSSLSSRSASYSTGFQNATAGQAIDRVTGIFLCRGDLSPEICRKCVAFAVNETLNYCPNEKEVTLYYEECMLRYSHRNILSTLRFDGGVILTNPYNISSNRTDQFEDFVSSTMNQAAVEAASSARKFYVIKARWTPLHILFGLVQCTPDLTRQDCLSCLQRSINGLPLYRLGGRLLYPSCNSRYELYAFYNETSIRSPPLRALASTPPASSPPMSSPPVSSPSRAGKGGNLNVLVVAIVVLVTVLFCFS